MDENDALSTRPQSAMASPSYLRDSGLNTKGESQTCAKARMDAPGRGGGPAGLSRRPVVCAGRRLLFPPQNDRRTRRTDFRESFLLSSALFLGSAVWTKRPYSARCERPGDHTPRKPFFTPSSKSHTSRFKEKASERIVYFHELDSQSKLVQSQRFMLERLGGQHKNRTLSRPQSADTWRRHHYGTKRKTSKLNDLLTIRTMDVHQQPSYEDRL